MGVIQTGFAAQETLYRYDELGRRIQTTVASSNTAQAATVTSAVRYDAAGNVAATRDAFGNTTRMSYDNFGHRLSVVDAEGGTLTWCVDAFGHVLSHTDLEDVTTRYTYTSAGQLATARSSRERTDYRYDHATGRLSQVDQTLGGVHTVATYGYDLAGNRTMEKTVADGRLLQNQTNTYDRANRLAAIDATGIRGASYAVQYRFDQNGNRTWQHVRYTTDAGDVKDIDVVNHFDRMNREDGSTATVDTMTHQYQSYRPRQAYQDGDDPSFQTVSSHRIRYDAMGNRVEDMIDGATETYQYDAQARLQSVYRDGKLVASRRYDGAGRTVEALDGGERRVNAYDAGGHLLRQRVRDAGGAFQYDVDYVHYTVGNPLTCYAAAYDRLGNNTFYAVYTGNDPIASRTSWTNIYYNKHGDAWRDDKTTVGAPKSTMLATTKTYAGNNLARVDKGGKDASKTTLAYSVDGQLLEKRLNLAANNATHILLANGELVGSSDNHNESFSEARR
nr:hypothetical protein [Pseudoduganella ginsengisoli]